MEVVMTIGRTPCHVAVVTIDCMHLFTAVVVAAMCMQIFLAIARFCSWLVLAGLGGIAAHALPGLEHYCWCFFLQARWTLSACVGIVGVFIACLLSLAVNVSGC